MGYNFPGTRVDLGGGRGWLDGPAAASLFRIDRAIGHRCQISEAGRTWEQQMRFWQIFQAGGNIALHPDAPSEHQKGKAIDSDEAQQFVALMEEHGWRRTVYRWGNGVWTLVERWHFEYFAHLDKHINDGAPASDTATPIPKEWDEMATEQQIRDIVAKEIRNTRTNEHFIVSYASSTDRNGIVLAGFGYWHKLTKEEWDHFNWLQSNNGLTIFAGLHIFTPINDRSYDILRDVCLQDGVAQGEGGLTYQEVLTIMESAPPAKIKALALDGTKPTVGLVDAPA